MKDASKSVLVFAAALRKLVETANKDGGKSYDDLAEKIRQRSADGLIEEAIGYLPEGTETLPEGSFLKPLQFDREGKILGPHPGSFGLEWWKKIS
jgi:hypothetical protein